MNCRDGVTAKIWHSPDRGMKQRPLMSASRPPEPTRCHLRRQPFPPKERFHLRTGAAGRSTRLAIVCGDALLRRPRLSDGTRALSTSRGRTAACFSPTSTCRKPRSCHKSEKLQDLLGRHRSRVCAPLALYRWYHHRRETIGSSYKAQVGFGREKSDHLLL